jgi:transcriptional regulator with XRE-family HTH domain
MDELADAPLAADLLAEAIRHVGATVRDLREASGLTQGQAGERLGMSQPEWSRLENGVGAGPTLVELLAIQHLFGVESLETFFGAYPSRRILQRDTTGRAG